MDYTIYERLKADWISKNPDATYQEYEAAIREIAKRVGI